MSNHKDIKVGDLVHVWPFGFADAQLAIIVNAKTTKLGEASIKQYDVVVQNQRFQNLLRDEIFIEDETPRPERIGYIDISKMMSGSNK